MVGCVNVGWEIVAVVPGLLWKKREGFVATGTPKWVEAWFESQRCPSGSERTSVLEW